MLPTGIITLWFGSLLSIPAGWILCNGAGGTPDLRNKFVVGAGDTYAVDALGGAVNHDHDFTGDGHTHVIPEGVDLSSGFGRNFTTDSTAVTGTTDLESNLPPYHALAYIMKT